MFEKLWKRFNKPTKSDSHLEQLKQCVKTDDHLISLEQLCERHKSNLDTGLDPQEVTRRQEKFGLNRLAPPLTVPKWVKFCSHIFEGFSTMLWIGAVLCIAMYLSNRSDVDNLYLGIVLIMVVICSGIFSYMQEAKSGAIMESFNKLVPQHATVIRNGQKCEVDAEQLVVGDVVEFKVGEIVPADVRVTSVSSCKVDNSSLTGESDPQSRVPSESNKIFFESRNMAFFSTNCVEGWAKGLVIAIGDQTAMGRIAVLTSTLEQDDTPLAKEISHFIHLLTVVSIALGTVFLVVSLMLGTAPIDSIMFFISIIVANVPEGLLATVTVCLTLTAKRMASKNCLVKNLPAVETLGSTSVICSDKTGTLTQNRMTVSHLWVSQNTLNAGDIEHSHISLSRNDAPQNAFEITALVCCLCSKAEFKPNQQNIPIEKRLTIGDASESAILKFMEATLVSDTSVANIRTAHPKMAELPFNSTNKFHLTIHRVNWHDCNFIVCIKGAPERILSRCVWFVTNEGPRPLDEDFQKDFNHAYTFLGGKGERVLGMAWLPLPKDHFPLDYTFETEKLNFPDKGLHFVGLISMIDPPRPGVACAVNKCRSAGIKVIMVTGDHPITAKAIAKTVNIISRDSKVFHSSEPSTESDGTSESDCKAIVVTGAELNELPEGGLDRVICNFDEIVFARTSPQQKLLIVEAFQRKGEIVAVTGDGVNDSPALKKADIGIAMGISGSDVSKQAADMILLDDNFASIVIGVEEGRIIFDNLKKSIAYTLTSNFPEMGPFLMYILFGIPLGMGTITILCVDLGTDIIPAISLAYEQAESDIMMRKPRCTRDRLVSFKMVKMAYGYVGVTSMAAGFMSYFVIMAEHGFFWSQLKGIRHYWQSVGCDDLLDHYGQEWNYAARKRLEHTCQTAFLIAIVVTQYFDLVICKTRRNSILQQGMTNEVLNFALIVETSMAIFLCYCPGMAEVLKLFPLKWVWWTFGLPFGLNLFILDEWRRYEIRKHPGGFIDRETCY